MKSRIASRQSTFASSSSEIARGISAPNRPASSIPSRSARSIASPNCLLSTGLPSISCSPLKSWLSNPPPDVPSSPSSSPGLSVGLPSPSSGPSSLGSSGFCPSLSSPSASPSSPSPASPPGSPAGQGVPSGPLSLHLPSSSFFKSSNTSRIDQSKYLEFTNPPSGSLHRVASFRFTMMPLTT